MRTIVMAAVSLGLLLVGAADSRASDEPLSEEDIKHVVAEHVDEVRTCYRKHAMKQAGATGRVKLRMVVDEDGSVLARTIQVSSPGVKGDRFGRCVKANVRKWKFRESSGSTQVEYPFYFQHTRAPGAGPTS